MPAEFEIEEKKPGQHEIFLLDEGKRVSWLTIIDLKMHYGTSEITVGGIAGVYTPGESRKKGFSKKAINYAIDWMKDKGYSLSALFGIQGYYERYGFAPFMCEHTATLSLKNVSRAKSAEKYTMRLSEDPKHRAKEMVEMYEENNADRVASRVRDPKSWEGFPRGVSWAHDPKILIAEDDGLMGYAALERWQPFGNLVVAEIEAKNHNYEVYASMLRELYGIMLKELDDSLTVHIPPDHPVINVLLSCGCKLETRYLVSGGGMARVIGLKRILTEIAAILEQRSEGIKGAACICTPEETVTITVKGGNVTLEDGNKTANKIKLETGEATQMILGYRNTEEIISSTETHGNVAMLTELFPKTTPYVWQPDR